MEYWVEDSNWRRFGRPQGWDDWDFYEEHFPEYLSRDEFGNSRWNRSLGSSSELDFLKTFKHPNSHFRIQKPLKFDQWRSIMRLLSYIDVSRIEHMELELPHDADPGDGSSGMDDLGAVLRTSRFLGLKTLRIRMTTLNRGPAVLDSLGSLCLHSALQTGFLMNLHTLSLPTCYDVNLISRALTVGNVSRMRSFSIMSIKGLPQQTHFQLSPEYLEMEFFRSLEHLDFSNGFLDDGSCWARFISTLKVRNVPNLKSLSLSENVGVKLADMVPFLLSSRLENLVLDGCQIDSYDVEHFTDAVMDDAQNPLALRRLDLHNNELDGIAVRALVRLASSDKFAQLQDLDLSMNSGMDSRALITLMETIQTGHHPSMKVLIWARNRDSDAPAAQALVRLYNENDSTLPDEWYEVLYRFPKVTEGTGLSKQTRYRVQRIQSNDMMEHEVDWHWDLPHCLPASGSGPRPEMELSLRSSASSGMDHFGTSLESNRLSTVEAPRFRITTKRPQDPAVLAQGRAVGAHLAAALMTGQFTRLLTRSLSAGGDDVPILSLPAVDFSAVLGAWTENHMYHVSAFSILSMEGLGDLSLSTLHQKLESALKSGCLKSLQHLELSSEVLDGDDGWEYLTRGINSGSLDNITSVHVRKNALAEVGPVLKFDFPRSLMIMDGCWINSEQVWGLADAMINGPGTRFSLEELQLCNGVLDNEHGWKVLTRAIQSGKLANLRSLRLSQNALNRINLEDLLPLMFTNSFVKLVMEGCFINTDQVRDLADVLMNSAGTALALKSLDLRDNLLSNKAVDALVKLADSNLLPHLQVLNLGMNKGIHFTASKSLTETIRRGRLPSLESLIWVGNPVDDVAAEAMVEAYYANEDLTITFDIDWTQVSDPALKTKVNEYRARNIRLRALKVEHKDVLDDVKPLTSAKIFLCGFPEVGKTTLRRALTNSTPETGPAKEARTRGIELSEVGERNLTLTLWDIAGQEEYRVLHGTFFADLGLVGGKATIFVLVFRAGLAKSAEDLEKDLLYWFRFIASSSQKHVKRHVVIVLNCFGGRQCAKAAMTLWMTLIKKFEELFRDFLYIRLVPFSLDVRAPTSVQPLKDFLFGQAQKLLQNITVPRVCLELQQEMKRWAAVDTNSYLPIMSWEAFVKHVNLKRKVSRLSGTHLKAAALYLHEIGGIVYFDHKESRDSGSNNRSVVVLHPEWFCRQVVGELLLPEEMLEEGCCLIVNVDGLIPTYRFEGYFEHLLVEGTQSGDIISMLERVGLCYRKGNDEIMVPALIQEDDGSLIAEWEGEGSGLVIGRCLATEDHERTAIPMTLFRRLQVELAQDTNFGGRGDSEYRAGKFSSSFKVGELSFLIEVDGNLSNPNDDRIDILVKTVDPTKGSFSQVERVCEIMQKLQVLCFACCPGLRYDVKVIKPWSATEKTPEMTKRRLMSLREIKVLVMQGQQYSSWRVNGNAVELKTFLADVEMKEVLEIKVGMKAGTDEGAAGAHACEWEIEGSYSYYDSEFSEGSEDSEVSLDGVEGSENRDVSSQAVEESEHAAERKDDISGGRKEDSLPQIKEAEEGIRSNPLLPDKERASVEHEREFLCAEFHLGKALILDVWTRFAREVDGIHRHIDEGNQKLLLNADEGRDEILSNIQAHFSFSIAEKERSVPRFLILKRTDSSGFWTSLKDTVKGPFRKYYRLHFLCESHFDAGNLHWVEDQEGVKLSKRTDVQLWLEKVEPWVQLSYFVATTVAKIALTVLVPGTAGAIPSISTSTEEHDRPRDSTVRKLLDKKEQNHHGNPRPAEQLTGVKERLIAEGYGNVGTNDQLTDVQIKSTAKDVVNDLIDDIGMSKFVERTKLRRVFLKTTPQHESRRRSRPGDSILWVCENCLNKYGPEATDINRK